MGEDGAQLVEPHQNHKGHRVALSRQCHHVSPHRRYDPPIRKQRMGTSQHLQQHQKVVCEFFLFFDKEFGFNEITDVSFVDEGLFG